MKVTYDKPKVEPKYKLGDEFTCDDGNGMLSRIGHGKIGIMMITGEYRGKVWKSGVKAKNASSPTESEVKEAFGIGNFEQVNPREPEFPKVVLELESLDELKILWGRLNYTSTELDKEMRDEGIIEDDDLKYEMWDDIDEVSIGLGMKARHGAFRE